MPTSSVHDASALASVSSVSGNSMPHQAVAPVAIPPSDLEIKLPNGCNFVKVNGATTIALCKSAPEPYWDKVLVTAPSILLSLCAIGLSWWVFRYNQVKDQRSRSQSIQDDFWLRKIITPISIEPLLKYNMGLATSLPVATNVTENEVQRYWTEEMGKIGELALSFRTLSLVNTDLEKNVSDKMEEFEDRFVTYCGLLKSNVAGIMPANATDKSNTLQDMTNIMTSIFKLIQTHQNSVS